MRIAAEWKDYDNEIKAVLSGSEAVDAGGNKEFNIPHHSEL